ncbi:hypothetical protein LRAMOSA01125 [Lichtheimia ramosa]|uniref:Uncharacterized protein n=1 Tax=Lichtheimia ramosa TaxID=688394 RepID=A0A077WAX1_9FUNG|nr:hypothetical protein LRAMOSA01125 [Lichtheimia ramosa]
MRFFTSISIAALCFVASIQAAPQGLTDGLTGGAAGGGLPVNAPGVDQVTGALGNLPVVGQAVAQPPAGQAPGAGAATQQGGAAGGLGGLTGATKGLGV